MCQHLSSTVGNRHQSRGAAAPDTASSKFNFEWCEYVPRDFDREMYKARHLIENFVCKLKQFRAIATRYDKTARNFLGAIHLVASVILLN